MHLSSLSLLSKFSHLECGMLALDASVWKRRIRLVIETCLLEPASQINADSTTRNHGQAREETCSMTGSGLSVTSREKSPSSAPNITYCSVCVCVCTRYAGNVQVCPCFNSLFVPGCVQTAAQVRCSGHPLKILLK